MRKSLWIFLLAVLIPSAVLGWLALRSAEEQKIILERRTAELYQHETENLAAAARSVVDEQRRGFKDAVRHLLSQSKPDELAKTFSVQLAQAWPIKAVGFTIGQDGRLLSPSPRAAVGNPDWQKFLWDHGSFLGGEIAATVYTVPVDALTQPEILRGKKIAASESNYANANMSPDSGNRGIASSRAVQNSTAQQQAPAKEATNKGEFFALKKAAPSQSPNEKDVLEMKLKFQGTWSADDQKTAPAGGAQVLEQTQQDSAVQSKVSPQPKAAAAQRHASSARESSPVQASAPAAQVAKPEAAPNPEPQPSPPAELDKQALQMPADESKSAYRGDQANSESAYDRRLDNQMQLRQVQPQQLFQQSDQRAWSAVAPETTEFRVVCAGNEEGIVTRFVQDKLAMIFWVRPVQAPNLIFGCVIDALDLKSLWSEIMPEPRLTSRGGTEFVLALLDDKARPVSTTPANETGREWKRPFVASEIGEALPHWEAALYLMRPEQLQQSATGLRRTLTFLIVALLGAIALGGWLVVADARRQFALAQQKTDFVSNVSHELKTPLTSIRMFAELMLGGRPETQAKAPQYLRIIMVEAERLTRLINNVLDFAKLERRQKRFDKKHLDLHAMIARIWESHELHLRESGFTTKWRAASAPYPVIGDEDALAQILVNLLSNAEKYCGDRKEVELHTYLDDHHVCVSVLDRGPGVPPGEDRKIFEAFYRAHDSLSSGIQGSGLGLTLAQRLAEEHGGTIEYRARDGGGSDFTLKLPLARDHSDQIS